MLNYLNSETIVLHEGSLRKDDVQTSYYFSKSSFT